MRPLTQDKSQPPNLCREQWGLPGRRYPKIGSDQTEQTKNCYWPDGRRDPNFFQTIKLGCTGPPVRDPRRPGQYLSWVVKLILGNEIGHSSFNPQIFTTGVDLFATKKLNDNCRNKAPKVKVRHESSQVANQFCFTQKLFLNI